MKIDVKFERWFRGSAVAALLAAVHLFSGCGGTSDGASDSSKPTTAAVGNPKVPPLPAGVTLRSDGNIQGYWVAEGFKLKNYDGIQIEPTVFAAIERENEVETRSTAMRVLPEQIASKLREANVFTNIYSPGQEPTAGGKTLKLRNIITEYSQGGNVGRAFGGVFGAGQPVVKVRGQLMDGEKVVFVYELKRSGEGDEAKFLGAGKSNEEIQRSDIEVLARDLVQLLQRTAGS